MADKHTPGPWSCVPSIPEEGVECFWIENGAQRITAVDGPQNEEREATARLIAAAPELMEAVEAMIEWDDRENDHAVDFYARMDLCAKAFDKARAALSKARGDDNQVECQACYGKGFNDVERQVAERKSDVQTFRETCDACEGTGKVSAGGAA